MVPRSRNSSRRSITHEHLCRVLCQRDARGVRGTNYQNEWQRSSAIEDFCLLQALHSIRHRSVIRRRSIRFRFQSKSWFFLN
ncbi:hypothetical protein MPTK1_5g03260 [Marchantia polymorpha subsp. ruderalis]|uniref:Uncharacterized protein n=2 Tax=Marchantia polymorpha TaxID=3197 RepID=A0AAF6BEG6_MARPO|nr:hypothetical protein MARPO_0485s0002 [Marchantia polymorpha]BBN10400.1 hypothetical protein Mp_5g03260 [Marchantia polymorpha subsp. ruderalis]|eukprot:PTQ26743.1 hypothetical protein MARPO_0485s0002 [Marchantia polymorpha]